MVFHAGSSFCGRAGWIAHKQWENHESMSYLFYTYSILFILLSILLLTFLWVWVILLFDVFLRWGPCIIISGCCFQSETYSKYKMKTIACHVYCIFRINLHHDSWVAHQIWLRWPFNPFTGSVPILHLTFQPDHGREEQADTSSHQSHGGKWRNEEMQIGVVKSGQNQDKNEWFQCICIRKILDWNDCGDMFLNL